MIHIFKAAEEGAYWIGRKYIIASNWSISKHRFSPEEQKEFEKQVVCKQYK